MPFLPKLLSVMILIIFSLILTVFVAAIVLYT